MRESGFIGLVQVVFRCVRDGFGARRAWAIMLVTALLFAIPIALLALLVALLV